MDANDSEQARQLEREMMARAQSRLIDMGYEYVGNDVWRRCAKVAPNPIVADSEWDAVVIHIAPSTQRCLAELQA